MVTAGAANPVGVICDELKKCLQAAQDAQRGRRRELRAGIGDGQFVGFVLAEFLHGLAAVVGMDLQRRRGARLWAERNSSLPRKLSCEPLNLAVQRSIVASGDGNRERLIDRQLPGAGLNAGGHGHQVELGLGLSRRQRTPEEEMPAINEVRIWSNSFQPIFISSPGRMDPSTRKTSELHGNRSVRRFDWARIKMIATFLRCKILLVLKAAIKCEKNFKT